MIISMCPVKVENDRDIVFCEIVVIATVVEPIRIILVIIGIIQFYIGVFRICLLYTSDAADERG